jgi:putative membrane protein
MAEANHTTSAATPSACYRRLLPRASGAGEVGQTEFWRGRKLAGGGGRRRGGGGNSRVDSGGEAGQDGGMGSFFAHWVVTAISLVVADWALDGVRVGSGLSLAIAALVLGFVNALVRPIMLILTLPLTVLTLGLFYLVVNGAAFALAAFLVPGFNVASFSSAMGGALIVSLVSWFIGWLTKRPPVTIGR